MQEPIRIADVLSDEELEDYNQNIAMQLLMEEEEEQEAQRQAEEARYEELAEAHKYDMVYYNDTEVSLFI